TSGYDSLRLSQAHILWGLYHKRNVDYDFLIWEDFVFQVEHKNQKKSNEMYYPRFPKVIIHHFMSKDPSIPRRNKVNWHYVRDDFMNSKAYKEYYAITTGEAAPNPKASARRTKSGSGTSITPPTAAIIPIPTFAATSRLTAAAKGKQTAKASKAKSQSALFEMKELVLNQGFLMYPPMNLKKNFHGTLLMMKVLMMDEEDERDDSEEGEEDDDDEKKDGNEKDDADEDQEVAKQDDKDDTKESGDDDEECESDKHESDEETQEEESINPIPQTPEDNEDENDGEEDLGLNIGEEERHDEEEEEGELYRDQESSSVSIQFVTSMLNPPLDVGMDSIFETTSRIDVQTPTFVAPLPITTPTMTSSTIAIKTQTSQAPTLPTPIPSEVLQHLPTFGSLFCFDDRLRSLEQNFSEVMQTNQFADWLHEEAERENDEFLRTVDENIKKIIKEQVKEQVKAQVSKILPRIEQVVNEQLKAEVLTRSSHSSRISYDVAADLFEMELKKILIEKMKGNKESVTLKRRYDDDDDKDEEPSAGPDRGSKRCREGKEPESASTPSKTATKSAGKSTTGSRSRQASASESAFAEETVQTTCQMEEPSHLEFEIGTDDQPIVQSSKHPEWFSQPRNPTSPDRDLNKTLPAVHGSIQSWISELAKQADTRSSFNELMDTPLDFSNFIMNRLRVDTLTPELLAGPTYDLVNGSYKSLIELKYHLEEVYKATTDQLDWVNPEGQQYPDNLLQPLPLIPDNRRHRVIPFAHFINNYLEYLRGGASSRKYTTSVTKTKAADYGHIKWIEDLVPRTMWIQEPIDYDKHAL
nr:hypothetical protein [Tanacetum cinerariifolium]